MNWFLFLYHEFFITVLQISDLYFCKICEGGKEGKKEGRKPASKLVVRSRSDNGVYLAAK